MSKTTRLLDKIRIILNPTAGKGSWRKHLGKLRRGLKSKGFKLEIYKTEGPGDATIAAQEVDNTYHSVVTIGGDGTINEVINGLGDKQIPLAIFPMGTGNVLGKEFKLPQNPEAFVETVSQGVVKQIDLGEVGGRQFHSFLGAGMDGHIVREISRCRKGNMKQWHYIWPLLNAAYSYTPTKINIKIDGKLVEDEATTVLVGNVRSYGGPFEVTNKAISDDGLLDVCCVTGSGIIDWSRYLWGMLWKKMDVYRDVHYFRGKEIEIWSEEETPVQIDGDFAGTLPVNIKVVPRRTSLIIPALAA